MLNTNAKYESVLLSTLIYIQTHLEGNLSLDFLATRVGYSPFNFHRLFREIIGEPVKEYIRRLRLERGAYRLKISDEPILKIALDAGFKTHESFTRAFIRKFGVTPSAYRKNYLLSSPAAKKMVRPRYFPLVNSNGDLDLLPNQATAVQVRLEKVRPIIVAFVRHVGPYEEVLAKDSPLSGLWEELFHWGNVNQLINDNSLLMGIPQDDPTITAPEKQRFDVCVQINEFRNPIGHIGCQTIQPGVFGVGRHYGSFEKLFDMYTHIYATLIASGSYQMRVQPPFEIYSYSQLKGDIRLHFTDVYLPIAPVEKRISSRSD